MLEDAHATEAAKGEALSLPVGSSIVTVQIINTTTNVVCPTAYFLEPAIVGQEHLNLPTFAFLVENKKLGTTILFDLGCRKDWWNLSPVVQASIRKGIAAIEISHGITEILEDGGVDLNTISSIILSHSHLDHIGDPSLFPKTTELVVGPGFERAFLPGYPTDPLSTVLDTDIEGRKIREIDFSDEHPHRIGNFRSYDFFGDGSFYLLDSPGHSVAHISALARTTVDTFVLMGGDTCHYAGAIRPTQLTPLPEILTSDLLGSSRVSIPCVSSVFAACHPDQVHAHTTPFYSITKQKDSWYVDQEAAQISVDGLKELDGSENVFMALAHDVGLLPVVEWFPRGSINNWKALGWKERSRWGFLAELPIGGQGTDPFVPGLMRDGSIID